MLDIFGQLDGKLKLVNWVNMLRFDKELLPKKHNP